MEERQAGACPAKFPSDIRCVTWSPCVSTVFFNLETLNGCLSCFLEMVEVKSLAQELMIR